MRRGAVRLQLDGAAAVAAPPSGVHLGPGPSGPVSLRLFRSSGTRIALASDVAPAQVITIRTAAAGAAVQVISARPQLWEPLLRHAAEAHLVRPGMALPPTDGPTLLVDDRPTEVRATAEVRPWQCRLDVRTHWTPSELSPMAHADVAVFGAVPPAVTDAIAAAFAVPPDAVAPLATLAPGVFALLRRARLEYVSLDPTPDESQVLALAR
jgi:ESX secretion system protein EccE